VREESEVVKKYKKFLQENPRAIVYYDMDEFPNADFLTNSYTMTECEKLLGSDYKVFYNIYDDDLRYILMGVCHNMWPCIVLYKNGTEIKRTQNTFHEPKLLAEWIKEQYK